MLEKVKIAHMPNAGYTVASALRALDFCVFRLRYHVEAGNIREALTQANRAVAAWQLD